MADGKVVIDTALNNNGFVQGVNGLKNGMNGLGSVAKKLGGLVIAAFSIKAIVDFGKAAVDLGSSVAEVQNVVDVAFGDMAYKIEDFAKTSIKNFGMSKLAAKETASNFMAMGKSMGLSTEAASDMAVEATGLTGDIASFFNISQDLAKVRLRGIWTGETEALKELGVVMTETNLKEYALASGIAKSYDEMNQAERVTLRYQYVTNALSLASGDFVRTQDNWANQTRVLSEQWKEFMSIVGQALITVLRPLVVTLNAVVAAMIDTANTVNSVITSLFGGTSTQMQQTQQGAENVGDAIEGSVEDQEDLTGAVEQTNKAQKKSLANFDEINKLSNKAAAASSGDSGSTPSTGGITKVEGEEIEGLSAKMEGLVNSLKAGFQELKGWVVDFFQPFKDSWEQKGAPVLRAVQTAASKIIELLRSIGTSFMDVWSDDSGVTLLNTIYSIAQSIFDIAGTLADRFRLAWEANNNGTAIWQAILDIIQSVLSFVDRLAAATLAWVQGLNLEPIVSSFRRFLEALKPVVDLILDGLAWGYENVLLPLASWVIEEAAPAALDLLSAALDALTPVIEALKPFASWLWENFLLPLGQWTGGLVIIALNTITEALRKFGDWARDNGDTIRGVAIAIGVLLETILAYCIAQKIPTIITALTTAFSGLAAGITAINVPALLAATALASVVFAIIELSKCWDQMEGWQRVIAVMGVAAAAAAGAALAFGILHTTMTMGIAAAAIVAGIVAVTVAISSAQSKIKSTQSFSSPGMSSAGRSASPYALSTSNIPHLAKGAVIPANREFLAVLGDQKSGTNIEAPVSEIEAAVARGIEAAGGSNAVNRIELIISAKPGMAREIKFEVDKESRRRGVKLVQGV